MSIKIGLYCKFIKTNHTTPYCLVYNVLLEPMDKRNLLDHLGRMLVSIEKC